MRDPEFHHREHRGHRGRKEKGSDPDPNPFFLPSFPPSFRSVSVISVLSVVKSGAKRRDTSWLAPMPGSRPIVIAFRARKWRGNCTE
jgi:hypothetical protein